MQPVEYFDVETVVAVKVSTFEKRESYDHYKMFFSNLLMMQIVEFGRGLPRPDVLKIDTRMIHYAIVVLIE